MGLWFLHTLVMISTWEPADVYILQCIEHNKIWNLHANHIIGYYRSVDDIFIVYNTNNADIHKTLTDFNNIHPALQFIIKKENSNFLDVTVTRKDSTLTYNIYRKPTATSHIIHNSSCHPPEHKTLSIRHLIHRLTTYLL